MSKKATKSPAGQLPPDPSGAVIPENHPGDVRTYPKGSKIIGGTLELPDSGIPDSKKKQDALDAAIAKREGVPFVTDAGVNLGADVREGPTETMAEAVAAAMGAPLSENMQRAFGLAAATAEDREKEEQNMNEGSLLKPQDDEKLQRMELRDKIEAHAVRHERHFDNLVSGVCFTDSPLTTDAIRQLRMTALALADDPTAPIDELHLAAERLVAVSFDYPKAADSGTSD